MCRRVDCKRFAATGFTVAISIRRSPKLAKHSECLRLAEISKQGHGRRYAKSLDTVKRVAAHNAEQGSCRTANLKPVVDHP